MFSRVANKNPSSESSKVISLSKPKPKIGRERLQYFADQIRLAHQAIEDLEQRVSRFAAIIVEADNAQRSLQDAINADGGIALEKYSAGQARPEDAISKLVAHAKTSGEASAAAKMSLPHTESLLENARSQLVSLGDQRNTELNRVLANLADWDARAYEQAFAQTCMLHDKLVGYATVAQASLGDIQLIIDPLKVPRFALPSMGSPGADPFLRHRESDLTVNESARKWATVRSRLEADSDADISDLITTTPNKVSHQ